MSNEELDYGAMTSFGDDEPSGEIKNVKVYDGKGYYVTVRLTDIPNARFTEDENPDTGEPERGLFIPLRHSGVTVTPKKKVLMVCKAEISQVPQNGYTHLLTQICDMDTLKERQRLGFHTGFCGKMRPIGSKKNNKKY